MYDINEFNIEEYFEYPLNKLNEVFSDIEKECFAKETVKWWHKKGFPYYSINDINLEKEIKKMISFDINKLELDNNELQQVMHGLNVINLFHPHMWHTKCRNQLTPYEVFIDKELFKKAILKRLKMSDSKLKAFNVRKSLKIFSGAQSVSNFRPTIAKYIYEKYADKNSIVLDPCMGYSGRLFGSFSSNNVKKYVGIDPSTETYNGNILAYNEFMKYDFKSFETEFIKLPFEDTSLEHNSFDLIFTSPPYFNIEKYSYEDTQSWIRYKTFDDWINYFLIELIQKSYEYLKPNKFFILNVAGNEIIYETKRVASSVGFKLIETKFMRLSNICGRGKNKKLNKFKLEPIFIFEKVC